MIRWVSLPVRIGFLVWVVMAAIGYTRYQRQFWRSTVSGPFGFVDLAAEVIGDTHFIAFGLVTPWLILTALYLRARALPSIRIRVGSELRGHARLIVDSARTAALVCLVTGIVVWVMSRDLPATLGAVDGSFTARATALGLGPIPAVCLQNAAIVVFFVALASILSLFSHGARRGRMVGASAVVLALWGAASAAGAIPGYNPASLLPFFSVPLHLGVGVAAVDGDGPGLGLSVATVLVVLVAVLASGFAAALFHDLRRRGASVGGFTLWIPFSALLLVLTARMAAVEAGSGSDLQSALRFAFSGPAGSMTSAFFGILLYVGFGLCFHLHVVDRRRDVRMLELLRFGSGRRRIIHRAVAALLLWAATLAAVVCTFAVVFTASAGWPPAPATGDLSLLAVAILVNGTLQMGFVVGLGAVIGEFIPGRGGAALTVVLLAGASYVPGSWAAWNPMTAAGTGRIAGGPGEVLAGTALLLGALVALTAIGVLRSRTTRTEVETASP